jgi:hypothetical protein
VCCSLIWQVDAKFGYCVRVSRKEEAELRKKKKANLSMLQTRKDGVLFRDSALASKAEE